MGQIIKSFCVCACVRVCVCPSVDTLTVAFLRRFSPNWTQTCKPSKVRTSSLGVNIAPPFFHFPPKNPQFWGVNRRFQRQTRKIEKRAYFQNYCIDFNQILHSDKDHQMPFVGGPHTRITNPRWRTAAILEKLKNRHISAAVQPILTKFGTVTQFGPRDCLALTEI